MTAEDPNSLTNDARKDDPTVSEPMRVRAQELINKMEATTAAWKNAIDLGAPLIARFMELTIARVRTIITIGYGSFFAIWALSKQYMTPGQVLITALLMLLSVLLYMSNELRNAMLFRKITDMLPAIETGEEAALKAFGAEFKAFTEKATFTRAMLGYLRPWMMRGALVFALLAVAVMLWALFYGLWMEYAAPLDSGPPDSTPNWRGAN